MCFPWSKLNHHHVGLNFLVKSCTKKCTGLTRNLDPYPAITAIKVQISYPHGYWIATNWPEPNYLSVKEFKANPIPHHRFARLKHQCKRCANHWKVRLLERWRRVHPPTEGGAAGAESLVGQGQMSHRSQPESAQRFATRSRWPPVGSITKTIITFVRTFLTTYLSPRSAVLAQHQQSTLQRAPFGHATNRWVGGMWFGLIQHENPSLSGGILNHLPVPNIAWNGGNWGPYWNSVIGCTLPRKLPLEFQTGCHPESWKTAHIISSGAKSSPSALRTDVTPAKCLQNDQGTTFGRCIKWVLPEIFWKPQNAWFVWRFKMNTNHQKIEKNQLQLNVPFPKRLAGLLEMAKYVKDTAGTKSPNLGRWDFAKNLWPRERGIPTNRHSVSSWRMYPPPKKLTWLL